MSEERRKEKETIDEKVKKAKERMGKVIDLIKEDAKEPAKIAAGMAGVKKGDGKRQK